MEWVFGSGWFQGVSQLSNSFHEAHVTEIVTAGAALGPELNTDQERLPTTSAETLFQDTASKGEYNIFSTFLYHSLPTRTDVRLVYALCLLSVFGVSLLASRLAALLPGCAA